MIGFLVRRIGQALVVISGDPDHLLPGEVDPAVRPRGAGYESNPVQDRPVRSPERLDAPIYCSFGATSRHFVHLNLGYSYKYNQGPPGDLERLPKTSGSSDLGLISVAVAIPSHPPVVRRNKPIDYALQRLVLLLRDARLPARNAAHHLLLFRPQLVPGFAAPRRAPWASSPTPARSCSARHTVRHHGGLVQPLHALVDDGRPRRGLRAHRSAKGPAPARALRPRPAQRPHPDDHPSRALPPGIVSGRSSPRTSSTIPAWPAHRPVGVNSDVRGPRHHLVITVRR